ncbi:MAG: AMMECR1 domain-containing protein [Alteromonadaceae bacterium]|nr:MAG: AMMECR1 domain-containing protein [Alteromonadaceae bacterium]
MAQLHFNDLTNKHRRLLTSLAWQSIEIGMTHHRPLSVGVEEYPVPLQSKTAAFITIKIDGVLRGCMGSLEAKRPLVQDIVENAFAAAFRDTRFSPLTHAELDEISIELSLLTEMQALDIANEQGLKNILRPNIDGLMIQEGNKQATFLPQVWQEIPDCETFIQQLKREAGLSDSHWSDNIKCWRYQVHSLTNRSRSEGRRIESKWR